MQFLTYISLVFTMLLWGGTFVAGRLLAGNVPPASAAFLRFFIASLALYGLLLLTGKKPQRPKPKLILPLCLLGMTGVFFYNVFFFTGLQYIGGGRASLIIALNPLVITICAAIFLKEQLTILRATGVFISLIGAVLVITNGDPSSALKLGFGPGERALLGCVCSWCAYSLIGRSVLRELSPLSAVFYSALTGTVFLAFPAAREGVFQSLGSISMKDWASLSYLGILGTAVGFSLYYRGIRKIGAMRAAIFINLVPLFGLLLSYQILSESVSPVVLSGGLLVLLGVSATNYQQKKNDSPVENMRPNRS